MAFDSTSLLQIVFNITNALDFQTVSAPFTYLKQMRFDQGAGLNQADRGWADQRTIAPSANDDLDLNAGALTDPFGAVLTLARVKLMLIAAAAANANNVIVGGAAATQFSSYLLAGGDGVVVRPGGFVCLYAPDATGYAVGAGATDILRISNSGAGTSVVYDIAIIGAST